MEIENNELIEVSNSDIKNGTFKISKGVTSIGDGAFAYCESLESITIPDSVTSIGYSAFDNCTSLKSIIIPESVTSIGNSAFDNCTSLKSITITDSVTSISNCAFAYCESLESITIPDSVTSIGQYAFYGCTNLKSKRKIYKAFNPDLTCRDYQYELGKWSDEIEDIMICEKGYHYCTNLFDIFNYYAGKYDKNFVICECEIGNKVSANYGDSKHCTNKIKPIKKLEWNEVLNILNGGNEK